MTYASTVLGDSPIGFWELAESTGTNAADQTSNSAGTYSGTTYTLGVTGIPGGGGATGVQFSSTDCKVSIPNVTANEIHDVFSIEFWIKINGSLSSTYGLVGVPLGADPGLQLTSAGAFALVKNNTSTIVTSTTDITDTTTWHHIVATKNGSTVVLWLDGNNVTGTVTNATMNPETTGWRIGNSADNSHAAPPASFAMVAVYSSALTSTQVGNHYTAGSTSGTKTTTQTAVSRIQNTVTKTQTAVSRVSNTFETKTQTAVARISEVVTKTQSAVARVTEVVTKTQSAIAKLVAPGTRTKTQPAVSRIKDVGLTATQTAIAHINPKGGHGLLSLAGVLNQLAGTTGLSATGAANSWASLSSPNQLSLIGALNKKNNSTGQMLDEVCNNLAGTTGLSAAGALNVLAGNTYV